MFYFIVYIAIDILAEVHCQAGMESDGKWRAATRCTGGEGEEEGAS